MDKSIKVYLVIIVCLISSSRLFAQNDKHLSTHLKGFSNFKASAYFFYKGGLGVSLGYAYWIEQKRVQQGINASINGIFFGNNLANKNRAGSRQQFSTVISPLIAFRLNPKIGYYEDINSFYFGNSNAVQTRFKNTIILGTNLVLSPKSNRFLLNGKLSEQNVYSSKNRFQQLIHVGVRFGGDIEKKRPFLFTFNLYEDFILVKSLFQTLADHYDRFYTGGGNLGFKFFAANKRPLGFTVYDDVYTGSFERDMFDFPDIYDLQEEKFGSNNSIKRRNARYVAQEPGQKLLNVGRLFGYLDIPLSNQPNASSLQIMFGLQGGDLGMGFQNAIHDVSLINKINPNQKPEGLYVADKEGKKYFERLHHFYPIIKEPRFVTGIGIKLQ